MGALSRKLLLAGLISNDRSSVDDRRGLFHGDDGTLWQSGNAIDVGDEKFSSAGALDSAGRSDLVITDDAMDPLVWQGAMAALNEMAIGGHGADRGKIVSVLRLEGIIEKITMIIDDTVVCDNGKILV